MARFFIFASFLLATYSSLADINVVPDRVSVTKMVRVEAPANENVKSDFIDYRKPGYSQTEISEKRMSERIDNWASIYKLEGVDGYSNEQLYAILPHNSCNIGDNVDVFTDNMVISGKAQTVFSKITWQSYCGFVLGEKAFNDIYSSKRPAFRFFKEVAFKRAGMFDKSYDEYFYYRLF